MAFTPVSVIGPASTQILVGQFQQNHPNILKNRQTRERDRHDADYTSLGGCDCASLLAGIPQSFLSFVNLEAVRTHARICLIPPSLILSLQACTDISSMEEFYYFSLAVFPQVSQFRLAIQTI